MKSFGKFVAALSLLCVALAALAAGASATKAQVTRLDPSFGKGGKTVVGEYAHSSKPQLAMMPGGRSYVLDDFYLFAFKANGRPDTSFGKKGRVRVRADIGKTVEVADVAVDSEGRALVTGTVEPDPGSTNNVAAGHLPYTSGPTATEAFVIRYLPNGRLDPSFGASGEVNTTFSAPRIISQAPYEPVPTVVAEFERPAVKGSALVIAAGDQPVVGGSYVANVFQGYGEEIVEQAFAVRLATNGFVDPLFGGGSYTELPGVSVRALAGKADGGLAALTFRDPPPAHFGDRLSLTGAITANGSPAPDFDPAAPSLYTGPALAVDPQGRMLVSEMATEEAYEVEEGEVFGPGYPRLLRLLPNGDLDTGYGHGGAAPLKPLGEAGVRSIAVDSKERAIVGVGSNYGPRQWKIARVDANGTIDHSFAKGSVIQTAFGKGTSANLRTVAIDAKGRILALGTLSGEGWSEAIALARYLPRP